MAARSEVAVVGVGTAGFHRSTDDSVAALASRAVEGALEDAGLTRAGIDALFVHIGSPRGLDYDALARLLALDVGFAAQTWAHGRFTATVIQHAALALETRLADCALCIGAFRNSPYTRHGTPGFPDFAESLREGGGPHAEQPATGLIAPIGGAAMATRRYFDQYGIADGKLAAVAIAQRKAAALNPLAALRDEITEDDYAASPPVVEPLRRLDCFFPVDTAVAVILTRLEDAASLQQRPVRLVAFQGLRAGPNEFVFGQPGLGVNQRDVSPYQPLGAGERVFRASGTSPSEVDALFCYDGFSPQVLWTLERFGFCGPGEAADWVQDGRIEIGGALPVNTNGGHLSEGHSNGWGQTLEIIRQLRGQGGDRQVADCNTALWATTFGDAILYAA
jgi:acetyl-CoA acetyltransferase